MPLRMHILAKSAFVASLLVPMALAQKPPSPGPTPSPAPPPPTQPSQPPSQPVRSLSDQVDPMEDMVLFLGGHVDISGGGTVPNDVLIQRVCRERERQQVYASPGGDFTMQLGSRNDSFTDASVDRGSSTYEQPRKNSEMGIPRRDLNNCDLRVTASGFYSREISLVEFSPSSGRIDVGSVILQRATKVAGATLNAAPYKAPKDARRAYEKGLEAQKNAKTDAARKYFEEAVRVYPNFTDAWYRLGTILEKANESTEARAAYVRATSIDPKYMPPYLSLASMALKEEKWAEARSITDYILDIDPLNHTNVTGGVWDLDPSNSADAYFYNALANYKLNNFEAAEKSALKAKERVDLSGRYPQLHLLLADLLARKSDYASAASEIETYLELVPHAPNAEQLRERIADLNKMARTASQKP